MGDDSERNTEKRVLLLTKDKEEEESLSCLIIAEAKTVGYLAAPFMAVTLSQYMLQIISLMMVGHLGQLSLSSTAIAVSFGGVTGFSLLLGMGSALETLSGQAYGAQQYHKIGIQTCTAVFCLILVCFPISLIWINMETILLFFGQNPLISHEAGKFAICLLPALFAYAFLQPIVRYFQVQSLLNPLLISSCATFFVHIPLSWALVYKTGLGNLGGAVAISVSNWLNVILLGIYMRYSSDCARTRIRFSMEMFSGIGEFFQFAIPSAAMLCLEWWSYELLILLSGLLPNPELETSVLSVCLQTISTLYTIPNGIGVAASTRISNELGAGNSRAANIAYYAAVCLTMMETVIVSGTLFGCRHVFGYVFSNDKEVVDYVTTMAPLLSLSIIIDSIQAVVSGAARGCGWQDIGAYINLGAFYLWGIPLAAVLAFYVKLNGIGLWVGIQQGAFLQIILLSIVTCRTNWDNESSKARERIFKNEAPLIG